MIQLEPHLLIMSGDGQTISPKSDTSYFEREINSQKKILASHLRGD